MTGSRLYVTKPWQDLLCRNVLKRQLSLDHRSALLVQEMRRSGAELSAFEHHNFAMIVWKLIKLADRLSHQLQKSVLGWDGMQALVIVSRRLCSP
jgi:hypothetical protein